MKNWKIPPKIPAVAKYIDCYWFLKKDQNDASYPKLNPDPAGHLIIANPKQSYQYENKSMSAFGYGSHFILPHCNTLLMDHSQAFSILGIKFHVGVLYTLKTPTLKPEIDQVVDINIKQLLQLDVFNEENLFNQFIDQPNFCRDVLDKRLNCFLSNCDEDKHGKLVRTTRSIFPDPPNSSITLQNECPSGIALSKIGEKLGYSQRTIERTFLRVTGFTLKQYQSMERLEAIFSYLHTLDEKNIRWIEVAAKFGFSDQSHLVRYLKSSIGKTPGEYIKQRDLVIDIYGDFE